MTPEDEELRFKVVKGPFWYGVQIGGCQIVGKCYTNKAADELRLALLREFRNGRFIEKSLKEKNGNQN